MTVHLWLCSWYVTQIPTNGVRVREKLVCQTDLAAEPELIQSSTTHPQQWGRSSTFRPDSAAIRSELRFVQFISVPITLCVDLKLYILHFQKRFTLTLMNGYILWSKYLKLMIIMISSNGTSLTPSLILQ